MVAGQGQKLEMVDLGRDADDDALEPLNRERQHHKGGSYQAPVSVNGQTSVSALPKKRFKSGRVGRENSIFARNWRAFSKVAFRKEVLFWWTLAGVALGLVLGLSLRPAHLSSGSIKLIAFPGELLMQALRQLVLPLISLALLTGVLSLRHTATGAVQVTRWALGYYLLSMLLAVLLGILLMAILQPGHGMPFASVPDGICGTKSSVNSAPGPSPPPEQGDVVESLLNIGRQLVPENIIHAAATDQFLGVIVFVIFFASTLASLGGRAEPLIQMIEITNDTIVKMIFKVVWCTPVGIASLIAGTVLEACDLRQLANSLALYCATILAGFAIHGAVVLPATLFCFTGQNPWKVARAFLPAFAVGFGTGSSAAAMPVTMECASAMGCQESIVRFVVPLGTNVNRDGAALYEAATVLFIAQAHGVQLSVGAVLVLAFTATLAAVGGASVPMGALVSMLTVLQAVNLERYAADLSLILAVDWAIGMFRTVLNIWGDCCAVVCVDEWSRGHIDEEIELEVLEEDADENVLPSMKGVAIPIN